MQPTTESIVRAAVDARSPEIPSDGDRPRNRLLASLEPPVLEAFAPHLETVRLESGDVLLEAHQPVTHVYFPESAGVVLMDIDQAQTVVASSVGYEGMVGVSVFSGEPRSSLLAATYLPGVARRMTAENFTRLAAVSGPLHETMLRYAHSFLMQVIAAHRCNSTHSVLQRCARWLVLTRERANGAEFPLALELMTVVVGAQRAGVSLGLRMLEERGLIARRPGFVRILNQRALEEAACECTRTMLEA